MVPTYVMIAGPCRRMMLHYDRSGTDTIIPRRFSSRALQRAPHLAQIPEQARHDTERFLGDTEQNMFIRRML